MVPKNESTCVSLVLSSFIKYNLNILIMAVYMCKKYGELNYLTPHAFALLRECYGAPLYLPIHLK